VKKIFTGTVPGNQVSTNNKNGEPEKRFQVGWDPINGGNGHNQPEEGKLKD
jgi:hypothetical protein